MPLRVVEGRQIAQILAMFMIVQFFGLLLASQVFTGLTYQQITSVQVVSNATSSLFYIVYIIVFSVVLLFLLKIYKGDNFFLILEGAVVFISSYFVFSVIAGIWTFSVLFTIAGNVITTDFIIGVAGAISLVVLKNKFPKLRNTAAIIASAGVGLILGVSFSFFAAMIFMIILAVYDYIAVFVTKHMVTMARAMSSRNLAFLIGVSEMEGIPRSSFTKKEAQEFDKESKEYKKTPIMSQLYKNNMIPAVARMELGTGDLAVPLMVSVAAYKVSLNFILSFFVILGAILGLAITALILRKYKRALPAIPPLLFGIVIGILSYFLLFGSLHL